MQEQHEIQRSLPLGRDATDARITGTVKEKAIELLSKLLVEVVQADHREGRELDDE